MKVAELEGALLDLWVAKAIGIDCKIMNRTGQRSYAYIFIDDRPIVFQPSESWSDGGGLIDELKIDVGPDGLNWLAYAGFDTGKSQFGKTALTAICRAVVSKVYGKSVPDEEKP